MGKEIFYQTAMEDLYEVVKEDFDAINKDYNSLSEYDKGRWMGLWEALEYIKVRKEYAEAMSADDEEETG